MKAEFINPFIKATINVIHKMAFIKVKGGKPYLKKDSYAIGDVSALVGLTSDVTRGNFTICFDTNSIIKIASNLFGEEFKELNGDVADVAGELANMISGQARREIEQLGVVFGGSIPSIFTGKNHMVMTMVDGPKIGIPFTMDNGAFALELSFER